MSKSIVTKVKACKHLIFNWLTLASVSFLQADKDSSPKRTMKSYRYKVSAEGELLFATFSYPMKCWSTGKINFYAKNKLC